jgi:hypothetical protein
MRRRMGLGHRDRRGDRQPLLTPAVPAALLAQREAGAAGGKVDHRREGAERRRLEDAVGGGVTGAEVQRLEHAAAVEPRLPLEPQQQREQRERRSEGDQERQADQAVEPAFHGDVRAFACCRPGPPRHKVDRRATVPIRGRRYHVAAAAISER